MSTTSIQDQIAERVSKLPPEDQKRVLAFAEALSLTQPEGVPGHSLLPFAGSISEEGCEQVDWNEW